MISTLTILAAMFAVMMLYSVFELQRAHTDAQREKRRQCSLPAGTPGATDASR